MPLTKKLPYDYKDIQALQDDVLQKFGVVIDDLVSGDNCLNMTVRKPGATESATLILAMLQDHVALCGNYEDVTFTFNLSVSTKVPTNLKKLATFMRLHRFHIQATAIYRNHVAAKRRLGLD